MAGNVSFNSVTAQPTNASAEGTVVSSPPGNYAQPGGSGNRISGVVNVTAGTSTTAIALRVRAGVGITGANLTPVGGLTHTLAAGAVATIPYAAIDPAGVNAVNQQYTVTLAQTSGTVAGTINYGDITVTPTTSAT